MSSSITSGLLTVMLITQLGSPRYRERERANELLHRLSPLAAPYLKAAKQHNDLEIADRSYRILARYYAVRAEHLAEKTRPSEWPRIPWLDMLPDNHPDRQAVVQYYLAQAHEKNCAKGPPHWDDYRLATKLYLQQLFRDQHDADKIRSLLDQMAASEKQWLIKNRDRYNPPLEMPEVTAVSRRK